LLAKSLTSVLLLTLLIDRASAATITLDFEGVSDSSAANTLYSGLGITFSGGVVLVSGAFGGSLNELEFPPRSGAGVFLNDSNTTTITFATPITSFQGFFTYGGPLTLNFYDGGNNLLTSVLSAYSANLALSGDVGSLPNEELTSAILSNAMRLDILVPNADFTLDELSVTTANNTTGIPEPNSASLIVAAAAAATIWRRFAGRARP